MSSTSCRALVPLAVLFFAACGVAGGSEPTVRAVVQDLVMEVQLTGELTASDALAIAPPPVRDLWEYKITFIAEEGAEVKQGDVVLSFDPTRLDELLKSTRAEIDRNRQELQRRQNDFAMAQENDKLRLIEAEANLRRTELKADRPADIVASLEADKAKLDHELAQQEVEYAKTKHRSARAREQAELQILRARVRRAEERYRELESDLSRLTVKAPRAGVVIHKTDRRGNKRKVGDNAWRGGVVIEIVSLEGLYALGQIDEVDVSKVAQRQSVKLRLDAYPDHEYSGSIRRIDDTVTNDGRKKVLRLEIALDRNEPVRMRPGMRFRGRVETGRVKKALQVPLEAVQPTPKGPMVLRVTRDDKVLSVPVQLGVRNSRFVQVLSGVGEGESLRISAPREQP
jgi:multidrug efflux pump subunit AcrA (membrane-fusion protein)